MHGATKKKYYFHLLPSKVARAILVKTFVLEVPLSALGGDRGYPGISSSFTLIRAMKFQGSTSY